jgi:hypothetical protein
MKSVSSMAEPQRNNHPSTGLPELIHLEQGVQTVDELRKRLESLPGDWVFSRTFCPHPDINRAVDMLFLPAGESIELVPLGD